MEAVAYTLTIKKSLVHEGPSPKYPIVMAFPCGLPLGAKVGIDARDGVWGRLVGTTWWINLQYAKR